MNSKEANVYLISVYEEDLLVNIQFIVIQTHDHLFFFILTLVCLDVVKYKAN